MSGLSAVVGYGVGSAVSALVRQFARAEPRPDYKRIAWIALAVAAVFGSILLMWLSHRWQNELRALIGIDDEPGFSGLGVLIVTAITGGVVLVGARVVRSWARFVIRQVNRVAPRPVSIAVGIVDQADKASAISMRYTKAERVASPSKWAYNYGVSPLSC